ncbi:MAG TPA: glycosyltransferase family 87 protein [Pyrinomonadaceae bacterium]|nr:glycosyltransferase family 87 protein [Pyrinomonadaceae bacterium]
MKLKKSSLDNIVLIAGLIFFLWFLTLPKPGPEWVYSDTLKYGATTLKGRIPFSDFAQTIVGFRALYNKTDPYTMLGPAFKGLGIEWDVRHGSTHPPTAFLFAAPIAFLPWPVASAIWAWLMLSLIVFSYRFYGLSWKMSFGLMPPTMLWPPASASLGQLTIIWMLGLAMAYYFRKREQFWSGVGVGLAAATKYLPGLLMIVFLLKRRWVALAGFISFGILSVSLVLVMNVTAIPRYLEENKVTSWATMQRPDNLSPLLNAYRYAGWFGVALLVFFFSLIAFVNRRYLYDWKTFPSTRVWMLLTYFSVACLPILWIYSLMPLLPALIFLIFQRRIATTILCLSCILIPSIFLHGDERSVIIISSVNLLAGLAFAIDVLPVKIFQKQWRASLTAFAETSPDSGAHDAV